ncbi:PREDICTED: uncharacterized protein LOC108560270 isoform X4 [Nicrophorus vespilloides]|uniref:Uncharacterized protein LOC108560270 isoform X4 n=1 Tax=Nicrophorus vespilloides TaxID=110193 RepID=A0ABM1MF78_NICVS|nr:PREDICTED: uncharacterized protein LOC108560270 isoform X4 [Nicrophorus vespilloides]
MSDEHRKLYIKKGTGTVPKVKQRNITNTSQRPPIQNERCSNVLSNNLGRDCNFITRQYRNPSRNPQYFAPMDSESSVRQNGTITSNGTSTPNTSATNSRRNSCGAAPKCDNVAKYPDKKQIEAKLGQIQEYLRITSSLMSNMKNTDEQLQNTIFIQSNEEEMDKNHLEQMVKDLLDSEAKLVVLLSEIDDEDNNNIEKLPENCDLEPAASGISKKELENKMEEATREMMMLKEQENFLLHSQLNVESQLREARLAQEKLMKGFTVARNMNQETDGLTLALNGLSTDGFDAFSNSGASSKNYNENQTDMDRELEERLKTLNTKNQVSLAPPPDQYQNHVDSLQGRILQMRDGNDNRNQLIQMLDNRDAQIQAEHNALQGKLMELQNKKMKVDQLVLQLQNMNEESDEDEMGSRVKMIVNMKDQLSKLKDMLDVVQNTENSLDTQNINESDIEDQVWRMCSKSDNLIQNDVRSNSRHVENKSQGHSSNERHVKDKQVNKKSMNANEREHIFQAQSREKQKRELEVFMSKSATSNLNRDVNSESKSDVGASSIPLYEGSTNSWHPVPSNVYPMPQANDRYSSFSDDCPEDDMNEYADTPAAIQPMPSLIYPTSNYTKRRSEEPRIEVSQESGYLHATSDRSIRSPSIATPAYPRNRSRSNANTEAANKKQMQKQLELIRSVCDSMLDQQSNESQPNIQVRNNLTPSPVYSEPRQYTSPSAHNMNALNVVQPGEGHAFPAMPPFSPSDPGNYQNWLATNNMQTQAFMLNTLNQCCQMLWLQQRELSSLRNTMQERNQNLPFDPNTQYPYLFPTGSGTNNLYNRSPSFQHPKMNPIGASMPNLNHAHCSQTNMDHACHANHCNVQNARILDSALNNSNSSAVHNHNQNTGAGGGGGGGEQPHGNNAVLHHPPPPPTQIWNGQALNNQVAPGNRANNYWDNFRSYSRQNLLSTKNTEGLQNASTLFGDRSNTSLQGLSLALSQPTQKQNTESQESVPGGSVSLENTPGRFRANVSRQRSNSSVGVASAVPPDVLNVNQKTNDFPLDFGNTGFSTLSNVYGNTSFESHDTFKDTVPTNRRNRNEWHDDARSPNDSPKSKLFEELRENVYKEVASLISANQGRPHFLIQLFRDLQLISSDPLRRRTLQSIQSVISNSINSPGSSTGATRQVQIPTIETENLENDNQAASEFFDLGNFMWPKSLINQEAVETNSPEHLAEVLSFLNNHNEDIFSDSLVHALRDTLVESTFSAIFVNTNSKDGLIQKHFASLLTEALEHYRGKKVQDVRLNVLQTVEDLLRGEISLIRLMRENISEGGDSMEQCLPMNPYDMQMPLNEEAGPQMQNGDLAEADQSRIEIEEDEGAVGGVLNIALERSTSSIAGQVLTDDNDTPKLDLVMNTESDVEFVEQGLDQVPTRLTTHSNSRSNTPSKDKKSIGLDGPEHF